MASLATHLSASIFLLPVGIRRLLSSTSLYLKNPSQYRSKPWYFSNPTWKNLDFYVLLIALPIASLSEFFLFLSFSGHPTYRFAFLQQAIAVFLFLVLLILILLHEKADPFLIHESFVFVVAGIAFFVEYSTIGKGFSGVSSAVYELLGGLTLVCAGCCLYLSIRPWAYFAEFLLCVGMVFKGTWVLQIGLNLFAEAFAFRGCGIVSISADQDKADVKCDLQEDGLRGVALMNLIFVLHALGVLIASLLLFQLTCKRRVTCGEGSGPLLAQLESECVMMGARPDFEIE